MIGFFFFFFFLVASLRCKICCCYRYSLLLPVCSCLFIYLFFFFAHLFETFLIIKFFFTYSIFQERDRSLVAGRTVTSVLHGRTSLPGTTEPTPVRRDSHVHSVRRGL